LATTQPFNHCCKLAVHPQAQQGVGPARASQAFDMPCSFTSFMLLLLLLLSSAHMCAVSQHSPA
jgi:hypothetical protein